MFLYPTAGPSSSIGSSSSLDRKRDRKRRTMAADAAIAAAQGLPPGINVSQMTRDERRALGLSLPISVADIINLPMDEFNDLLSKHELTEEQLTLCRDIRRRGKNKVKKKLFVMFEGEKFYGLVILYRKFSYLTKYIARFGQFMTACYTCFKHSKC